MRKLIIDIIPVAKGRPRFRRMGGFMQAYTPKKTKDYEAEVKRQAIEAIGHENPLECPLVVRLTIYRNIPSSWSKKKRESADKQEIFPITKPDIDNYAKAILDALNGVVFKDDSQIIKLTAEKYYSAEPRVEVLFSEMGNNSNG